MSAWLAIDTATDTAGVALHDGGAVVQESTWASARRHTVELAPLVEQLLRRGRLRPADLDGVAVAIGPGSYTGLRVGLAFAKGLALATGVPLVGVPTLDILAAPLSMPVVDRPCGLWAVVRAGRERLVAALYPPGAGSWPDPASLWVRTLDDLVRDAALPAWVAGELTAEARDRLASEGFVALPPAACIRRAGWLAELGRARLATVGADDAATLAPIYAAPGRRPA